MKSHFFILTKIYVQTSAIYLVYVYQTENEFEINADFLKLYR